MARTNIVIDEELVTKVMRLYGLSSKRAAVDFALRTVAGESDPAKLLELRGIGWEGDLEAMRRARHPDP